MSPAFGRFFRIPATKALAQGSNVPSWMRPRGQPCSPIAFEDGSASSARSAAGVGGRGLLLEE